MSEATTLPKHLGLILDGNRRWAKAHGKATLEGHQAGMETFKDISLAAFDRGVQYVSAYIFSTENWQRTQEEVSFLMGLVTKAVTKHLDTFHNAGVKILILGSRERLDKKVLTAIDAAVEKTQDNNRGTLALCFNYGGQQEIADAAQEAGQNGSITPETIAKHLYSPELPMLDLIIRTSGEQRLSGFMLWRAAYAELRFEEKLWPDYTVDDLDTALHDYAQRQRRFGA